MVFNDKANGAKQNNTGLIKYCNADDLQAQDYSPFGFNGKESDTQRYGEGNAAYIYSH